MDTVLDPYEVRVLGCLVEKDITTPEYYPMTINALVNACNQKSNRDPVVSWTEDDVADTVDRLRERKLAGVLTGGGNRVPKYSHRMQDAYNFGRRELALLCELMLRGPQTTGELRDRASRMYRFSDTDEVENVLGKLQEHGDGPLVMLLERQPGQKEPRWAHLLGGQPEMIAAPEHAPTASRAAAGGLDARVFALEEEVRTLREQLDQVRTELGLT